MEENKNFSTDIIGSLNEYIEKQKRILEEQDKKLREEGNKQFEDLIAEQKRTYQEISFNSKNKDNNFWKKIFNKMKNLFILLIGLVVLYLIARQSPGVKYYEYKLTSTAIGVILNNPKDYEGKDVTVFGYVTQSVKLGLRYYVIKDETGTITVFAKDAVPMEGNLIKTRGKFSQTFKIGGLQVASISEK